MNKATKATNTRTKSYMSAYIDREGYGHSENIFTMLEEDFDILNDIVDFINKANYPEMSEGKNPFKDCGIEINDCEPYITGSYLGELSLNPYKFSNIIEFPKALERCIDNITEYNDLLKINLYKYCISKFNDYQKKTYTKKLRIYCEIP